jgi:hypothetical protein
MTAPPPRGKRPMALALPPARPQPESWGNGFVDYPTMIQPILDRHCVRCHGGAEGIGGGIDLSGGWTWAFNISYEALLKNNLVGFLRCHNGDVTSSRILPPRTIGSGAAPLAKLLIDGHEGRIARLTRAERDLLLAWMDTNSNYYGTWDYTPHATCGAIQSAASALAGRMRAAGCVKCHRAGHVGNDWINLRTPQRSRILRAPLAKTKGGLGLAWCRDRKAPVRHAMVRGGLPPDVFRPPSWPKRDPNGPAVTTFASTGDEHYRAMLDIIRDARAQALARPRVDMPGAKIVPGECRLQRALPLPDAPPPLTAALGAGEVVELSWPRSAETIGLAFELHRSGKGGFTPTETTRIAHVRGFQFADAAAPAGEQHYALVATSGAQRSAPARAAVTVPPPKPPAAPTNLTADGGPMQIALRWRPGGEAPVSYHVYRVAGDAGRFQRITDQPVAGAQYVDFDVKAKVNYAYRVRAVSRRGVESEATPAASAAAEPVSRKPIFSAPLANDLGAAVAASSGIAGKPHGAAKVAGGALDLRAGGHVTFGHRGEFDVGRQLTVECWVRFDKATQMPVVLSCGKWNGAGWFLQRYQNRWRWYVGGANCDGGNAPIGRWIHVAAVFDGRRARLYQDGKQVASVPCRPDPTPWPGPLFVGQYAPSAAPQYQLAGRLARLRIYRCALTAAETAALAKAGGPETPRAP